MVKILYLCQRPEIWYPTQFWHGKFKSDMGLILRQTTNFHKAPALKIMASQLSLTVTVAFMTAEKFC